MKKETTDYKKELIQNLYQIQEFMRSGIFYIEEDYDILEGLNDNLYNSLSDAIKIIKNK